MCAKLKTLHSGTIKYQAKKNTHLNKKNTVSLVRIYFPMHIYLLKCTFLFWVHQETGIRLEHRTQIGIYHFSENIYLQMQNSPQQKLSITICILHSNLVITQPAQLLCFCSNISGIICYISIKQIFFPLLKSGCFLQVGDARHDMLALNYASYNQAYIITNCKECRRKVFFRMPKNTENIGAQYFCISFWSFFTSKVAAFHMLLAIILLYAHSLAYQMHILQYLYKQPLYVALVLHSIQYIIFHIRLINSIFI